MLSQPISINEPTLNSLKQQPNDPLNQSAIQRIAETTLQKKLKAEKDSKKDSLQQLTQLPPTIPSLHTKTKSHSVEAVENNPKISKVFQFSIPKVASQPESLFNLASNSNGMLNAPKSTELLPNLQSQLTTEVEATKNHSKTSKVVKTSTTQVAPQPEFLASNSNGMLNAPKTTELPPNLQSQLTTEVEATKNHSKTSKVVKTSTTQVAPQPEFLASNSNGMLNAPKTTELPPNLQSQLTTEVEATKNHSKTSKVVKTSTTQVAPQPELLASNSNGMLNAPKTTELPPNLQSQLTTENVAQNSMRNLSANHDHFPPITQDRIKKDPVGSFDNIMARIFAVIKRLIHIVENKAKSILGQLEDRTGKVEKLTELSSQIHWALSKKDANGAVNFNDDAKTKEMIDKSREYCKLPDGYEWNAEQVAHAKKNIEDVKSSLQNINKMDQTDIQEVTQTRNNHFMMASSILSKEGELGHELARNMGR